MPRRDEFERPDPMQCIFACVFIIGVMFEEHQSVALNLLFENNRKIVNGLLSAISGVWIKAQQQVELKVNIKNCCEKSSIA